MRRRITTRSGSVYEHDSIARTVTWPGRRYTQVVVLLLGEGVPFAYEGLSDGRAERTLRKTTPIVSIEELGP